MQKPTRIGLHPMAGKPSQLVIPFGMNLIRLRLFSFCLPVGTACHRDGMYSGEETLLRALQALFFLPVNA